PNVLPYAVVELSGTGASRSVLADNAGAYLLSNIPAGLHRLRALYIGHALSEVEVLVPDGGTVEVDLALAREPIVLPALTVITGPLDLPDVQPIHPRPEPEAWAAGEITLRTLEAGTGMVESGVAHAAGEEG